MAGRGAGVRRAVRGGVRRAGDAAVERYRTAVGERSRALPVYLRAADTAGVALQLRRAVRRSGRVRIEPLGEPAVPEVSAAAVSEAGELSFVLTGVSPWRRTIDGIALLGAGERRPLPVVVLQSLADVFRVNAVLPADIDPVVWQVVLVDADGEPLDLPTPDLAELARVHDA